MKKHLDKLPILFSLVALAFSLFSVSLTHNWGQTQLALYFGSWSEWEYYQPKAGGPWMAESELSLFGILHFGSCIYLASPRTGPSVRVDSKHGWMIGECFERAARHPPWSPLNGLQTLLNIECRFFGV